MTARPFRAIGWAHRTRLTSPTTAPALAPARAFPWNSFQPLGYCAAKTNGTLTVVVPLEAGNCQPRTRAAMQLERPR